MTESPVKETGEDQGTSIDTTGMSAEKRGALEVAEAAREKQWKHPSFVSQLFMGTFDKKLIFPFPEQSPEDKALGDEYCRKVAKFLEENLDPDEVDETRTIPPEVISGLADMGIFAMKVPKEYNGLGFSQVNYNRVMMTISSYCGSTAVLVSAHQSIGVPQPLKMFGTEEQKKKYFPGFREGKISAFALTEPDVGSDPAKMSATAEPSTDGSHYVLNGTKLWCTNGPIADILVVMAKTPPKMVNGKERQQITAFIVEGNWPGIEVVHRCDFMGLRGIQNGLIRFNNVKVPAENILWGEGRGLALALRTLNTGRLTIPACCVGMIKQCLNTMRRWSNKRTQWGSAVGLHEAGSQKLAFTSSMLLSMEAITWLTSHWADRPDIDIRMEAAMAKMFCTEWAWVICDQTLQFRGGRGFERAPSLKARGEEPFAIERMMRDSRVNTIIEGTTEIMHLFLAREALDPHLKAAGDLIKPKTTFMQKFAAALKAGAFYGSWYPQQWIHGGYFGSHGEFGELSKHVSYAEITAHRLARTFFHQMAIYGPKLEARQVILKNLVDIGTELFAIAATCSYTVHLLEKNPNDQALISLADHFCNLSKDRIAEHFRNVGSNRAADANRIAKRVHSGEYRWMEDGVIFVEGE